MATVRSSLTPAVLAAVRSASTPQARLQKALDHGLYILGAQEVLKAFGSKETEPISLVSMKKLVQGLTTFDPRLTPVQLCALWHLHRTKKVQIQSVDKLRLVSSVLQFKQPSIVKSGFVLASQGATPLPVSALASVVYFCRDVNDSETVAVVWEYIKQHYQLTAGSYTNLLFEMMRVLANNEKFKPQAAEIARLCLRTDPELANLDDRGVGGAAFVGYKLQDSEILEESSIFHTSRKVLAAQKLNAVQLNPKQANQEIENFDFTPGEQAGIVKQTGNESVELAETVANQFTSEDPVLVALCDKYIDLCDRKKFFSTIKQIKHSGLRLNLKLKFEKLHGDFRHAKRHYQNMRMHVPMKQRRIALQILRSMAQTSKDKEWVDVETRLLLSSECREHSLQ